MSRQRGAQGPHGVSRADCSAAGCPGNAGDGAALCRGHQQQLRSRLDEVPALLADLLVTISRQAVMVQHAGTAAETPMVWDERAATADANLRAALARLAHATATRHTDERDRLAPAMALGAAELSRWLGRNLHTLIAIAGAGEHFDDLDDAVHRARSAVDRPIVRSRFYVGPCPEVQGEGDAYPGRACPGEVWATVPEDIDDLAYLRCQECKGRWGTVQWRRLATRIQARVQEMLRAGQLP